jgi:hypothetical protein
MASRQAEQPKSVRKGPLITISCKCGQTAEVRLGERWKCPKCGRKFDTNEIPQDDSAEIRRHHLRVRTFPLVAMGLLVAAVIVLFVEGRTFTAIIAIPFLFAVWNLFGRPTFRSR